MLNVKVSIIHPYLKVIQNLVWRRRLKDWYYPCLSPPLPASYWSEASLFWPLIGCWEPQLSLPCACVSSYHVSMTTPSSPLPSPWLYPIGWGVTIAATHWLMFIQKSCVIFPRHFLSLLIQEIKSHAHKYFCFFSRTTSFMSFKVEFFSCPVITCTALEN